MRGTDLKTSAAGVGGGAWLISSGAIQGSDPSPKAAPSSQSVSATSAVSLANPKSASLTTPLERDRQRHIDTHNAHATKRRNLHLQKETRASSLSL